MAADLQTIIRPQLVRALVSRAITCPRTGEVLDVRTCVVLLDTDGDPLAVVSQRGWVEISGEPATLAALADAGVHVDRSTVVPSREASMAAHPAGKRFGQLLDSLDLDDAGELIIPDPDHGTVPLFDVVAAGTVAVDLDDDGPDPADREPSADQEREWDRRDDDIRGHALASDCLGCGAHRGEPHDDACAW